MRHQMARREFAHLTCANDKNILPLQRAENLFGQLHRNRRDRNRGRPHGGLRTHSLGHGKRTGKELIQLSAHRTHGAGCSVSLFHLPKNLGFTDHHRIQARSHAEDVAHCLFFAKLVQVRIQFSRGQMKVIVQKSAKVSTSVRCMRDHFHAIARGNNHAFLNARVRGEIAAAVGQVLFRYRQALPHFERRALVIHANELVSHIRPIMRRQTCESSKSSLRPTPPPPPQTHKSPARRRGVHAIPNSTA